MPSIEANLDTTACERCGASFHCGAAESTCWCAEVAVPQEVRDQVAAAAYDRCMCPTCLNELSTRPAR